MTNTPSRPTHGQTGGRPPQPAAARPRNPWAARGVPAGLAAALGGIRGLDIDRAFHAVGSAEWSWDDLADLHERLPIGTREDFAAVLYFAADGSPLKQLRAWAHVCTAWSSAATLSRAGLLPDHVEALAPTPDEAPRVPQCLAAVNHNGIPLDDLLLWRVGGVVSLSPPFVHPRLWALWRRIGLHGVGLHTAAVACAAGLDPREVIQQHRNGELDLEVLGMLAALRGNAAKFRTLRG